MPESSESRENEQKLPKMNNFLCYLPGGIYREIMKEDPKGKEIMDAIDMLLQEPEFSSIDSEKILTTNRECGEALSPCFDLSLPEEVREGWNEKFQELCRERDEYMETLRPLFNRLIDMGYTKAKLVS